MSASTSISQKDYLKKYLSGDVKKKKKKKISGGSIKRSVIVDDDIDLNSMRPLENDEVELYQMDEDGPQIAGIVDERPLEVKAQEYYTSKRWKVFGGEDGVNVIDSMNKDQNSGDKSFKTSKQTDKTDSLSGEENYLKKSKPYKTDTDGMKLNKDKLVKKNDFSPPQRDKSDKKNISSREHTEKKFNYSNVDEHPVRVEKGKTSHYENDSDMSPPRKDHKNLNCDSDASPPRSKYLNKHKQRHDDSDESPPRNDSKKKLSTYPSRYQERERGQIRNRSYSNSPPRRDKTKKHKYKSDSDNSPPRREKHSFKQDKADSDFSPHRKKDKYRKYFDDSPSRKEKHSYDQNKSDSDASPPRRSEKRHVDNKSHGRTRKNTFSDLESSPPRRDKTKPPKHKTSRRSSRSSTPPWKNSSFKSRKFYRDKSPKRSRRDVSERIVKRGNSDSDNSPRRRRDKGSDSDLTPRRRRGKGSDSDLSPPRKNLSVIDRPMKKALYKPNDDSSSDDEPKSKSRKMNKTLDGKQAGLQDAKHLKEELWDLKMREDNMFSKMDASVSGVGAAPVKRDRKTGQIRDLENEKEIQKHKAAKESVVNEKYYKWGKGIKQTEDAAVRAAEALKEMSKPLARYVDDQDLDEFLKAQDREGDPMLDYIKRKQSEATPLQGEKPLYKGAWTPNRFNIRPGYRWDGVVRSNGYEQEWFKTKNAKKARDEEAYKWSTSDM